VERQCAFHVASLKQAFYAKINLDIDENFAASFRRLIVADKREMFDDDSAAPRARNDQAWNFETTEASRMAERK